MYAFITCHALIIFNSFKYSNTVDLHNQAQKFDLALEKMWVTTHMYVCLYTTEDGMIVVDCWKIYKSRHRLGGSSPTVNQFADISALEIIKYATALTEDSSDIVESSASDV